MADQPAADKTERATPERLRKAKAEGQVAQSQEVGSALITAMMLIMLSLMLPSLFVWFRNLVAEGLSAGSAGPSGGELFCRFLRINTGQVLMRIAPIFAVAAAMSCFSSILVSGLVFSPKALKFDWNRVNPIKGIKNVISLQSLVRLLMSLMKLTLITVICYLYLRENMKSVIALRWESSTQLPAQIGGLIFGLMVRVCAALLVIAAIDFAFQKWNYLKKMRMTKQEVREERKQYEVSPEVRGKIRQIQIEMVRKRMLQDVPTADVVITNPTHVAVAMKYDMQTMDAPIVVAKGPGVLCAKIKEIAREHDVPIIERPVLARALFEAVEIGQPVPSQLFVAVAEVLAMIFRLRRKKKHMNSG